MNAKIRPRTAIVAVLVLLVVSIPVAGTSLTRTAPASVATTAGVSTPTAKAPTTYTVAQYVSLLEGTPLAGVSQAISAQASECELPTVNPSNFGPTRLAISLNTQKRCLIDALMSNPDWLSMSNGVPTQSYVALAERAKLLAVASPAMPADTLVLNTLNGLGYGPYLDVAAVPTPYLAFLALTAMPDGAQTGFHAQGHGYKWMEMMGTRYQSLQNQLLLAIYGKTSETGGPAAFAATATVPWGAYPDPATLSSTLNLRSDKLLAGVAFLQLATYQANKNGNLGEAFDALGPVSLGAMTDAAVLFESKLNVGKVDGKLAGVFLANYMAFIEAVGTAAKLDVHNLEFLEAVSKFFKGSFPDVLSGISPASLLKVNTVDTSKAASVLAAITMGDGLLTMVFNGGGLSGWGVVGSVTRNLPSNAAITEVGETVWTVSGAEMEGASTSYDWEIPVANLAMENGVLATLSQDPEIFQENGDVYQYTHFDTLKAVVEEEEPSTTYETKNTWGCALWSLSVGMAAGGTIVWGLAAGPPLTVIAASYTAAAIILNAVTDKSDCDQIAHYNAGFYHETGGHISYWGAFGWLGEGVSLAGGLVEIYGTVVQDAVEYLEPVPYDNAPEISGHAHGVATAGDARGVALDIANSNRAQFRAQAGLPGSTAITIEILCAAMEEVYGNIQMDQALLTEGPSGVCLRIEVGSAIAAGPLAANPPFGDVEYNVKGIGSTGYVKVNGNPVANNMPVQVNADGDGVNTG